MNIGAVAFVLSFAFASTVHAGVDKTIGASSNGLFPVSDEVAAALGDDVFMLWIIQRTTLVELKYVQCSTKGQGDEIILAWAPEQGVAMSNSGKRRFADRMSAYFEKGPPAVFTLNIRRLSIDDPSGFQCQGYFENSLSSPMPINIRIVQRNSVEDFCLDKKSGLYRHPVHCGKFISCSNARPYEMHCPANLLFNPKISVCDWPHNVQCVRKT